MSSSVFFKFKSSKEPSRIFFDGSGISVFDLKREIIAVSGLGHGTDFDLQVFDDVTGDEFSEDTRMIPRSSTVVAIRKAAARPGHGKAARYVTGKPPVGKNSHRVESSSAQTGSHRPYSDTTAVSSEAQAASAMFDAAWNNQLEAFSAQKQAAGGMHKKKNIPEGAPHSSYICHRCHQKGHWIQACPTNDDPNFANRPMIRRTTGIPKSQLEDVGKIATMADDGLTDRSKLHPHIMMSADGNFVIARPDDNSWEKFQAKANASTAKKQLLDEAGTKEIRERGLQCPLCQGLFVDPIKTKCCKLTYCHNCIDHSLANNDLVCPNAKCLFYPVIIDELAPDEEMIEKVQAYQDEKKKAQAANSKDENDTAPSEKNPGSNEPVPDRAKSGSPTVADSGLGPGVSVKDGKQSDTPVEPTGPDAGADSKSKKRPAEDELVNQRVAKGPSKVPPTGPASMMKDRSWPTGPATSTVPTGPAAHMQTNGQTNGFYPPGMNPMMMQAGPMNPMMMMMMMGGMGPMGPMGNLNPMGPVGNMGPNGYMMGQGGQYGGMNSPGYGNGQYGMGPTNQGQTMNGGSWNAQWGGYNAGPGPTFNGNGNTNMPYQNGGMANPGQYGGSMMPARGGSGNGGGNGGGGGGDEQSGDQAVDRPVDGSDGRQQQTSQSNQAGSQPTQASNFQTSSQQQSDPTDQSTSGKDSAYFRAPVNPGRHLNRRRMRRTDFTQLQ